MERDLDNELDPLYLGQDNFAKISTLRLLHTPDKVIPVCIKDPDCGKWEADFFLLLKTDEARIYLQAEDFSSRETEQIFIDKVNMDYWKKLQPGIYRFDITKYINDKE